jgi:CubicO group peptidase (beta-lactamase class C family)
MKKGIRRMEGTAAALMLAGGMAASSAGAEAGAKMDFSGVAARLEPVIRDEMREWNIRGITVALVHDQTTVHLEGFGEAGQDSIFRVGSISKLLNAVAVMKQVERGKLDLDAPLAADLTPVNPFPGAPAVTLRQLLAHRSGFPREGSVGGYMDLSEPGMAATVASVPGSVLVTRPGEKARYSNLAPTVAGAMVERSSGQSFEDFQHTEIFDPLGMNQSAWTLARADRKRIVVSHIRVADGRGGWAWRETPLFDLGTIPAGNLFSTAGDLARFAAALLASDGKLLQPASLAEMWRPQFVEGDIGFGLGFHVGKFRGHKSISHSGAVYGFSSSLVLLPEPKVAAIVLGNEDIANGRIQRIANAALSLLLEAATGEKPPKPPAPFDPGDLSPLAGDYESQSYWARLTVQDGGLTGDISGQPTRFRPWGPRQFVADSRLENGVSVAFTVDERGAVTGFTMGGQTFARVPPNRPPLPSEWQRYLGSYGPELIPIVIIEKFGTLYATTENMVDYRLTPMNRHVFSLPPGMYVDEAIVFLTDGEGNVHGMDYANMPFPRHVPGRERSQ